MTDAAEPAAPAARPKRTDAAKVRRAADHPLRPGVGCKAEPGRFAPAIDQTRCEGKADCIAVCPYDVFEVETIRPADYRALPFIARIKVRVHGMKMAYTPRAEACLACGLCVVACPEGAIRLVDRLAGQAFG